MFDTIQRDKRNAKITHTFQYAIKRCLIGEITAKDCLPVGLVLDFQSGEPVGPIAGKMAFDSDFAVNRIAHSCPLSSLSVYVKSRWSVIHRKRD
jgi:hypothetical protein